MEKRHLSFTQINMFLSCPRQYAFRYIEELKTPPSGAMVQGRVWHETVERNYRQKVNSDSDLPLGEMQGYFAARFEQELVRLSRLDYAAIVVESTLKDFLEPPAFSHMNPKAALNSMVAWSIKYRVPVFFACDRLHGNALTRCLLEKYIHYHGEDLNA